MIPCRKAIFYTAGPVFALAAGVLLHFLYDWISCPLSGVFSAVNESVWEHTKLVSVPLLAAGLWEYPLCPEKGRFWAAKAAGCWSGVLTVPVLFYTYTGATGGNALWADILVFAAAVLTGCAVFFALLRRRRAGQAGFRLLGQATLLLLILLNILWTFTPPRLPLFRDPVSGIFGPG